MKEYKKGGGGVDGSTDGRTEERVRRIGDAKTKA
jgi:hypothetical protein